jgi:hypothetical protein
MQVDKLTRKSKCCGGNECENSATFRIIFDKVGVPVCSECATKLQKELGAYLAPRSIKNKFKIN